MRRVVLVIVLALACRRDPSADVPREAGSRPDASARALAGESLHLSDDELVAFTRWQRDLVDLFVRHRAEMDAVASDAPSRPFDEVRDAMMPKLTELTARQAPIMKAHLDRVPLEGRRRELAEEATGGLFHVEHRPTGYELVVARDEVRIGAARRRFGAKAVDDILRRESLILAALQQP